MASLTDILDDRTTYPDDQKITLANGIETTLGDMRKDFVPKAAYTRKSQEVAREREALAQEKAQFEHAKTEAETQLAALAEKLVTRNGVQSPDEVALALERDPVAKRLMSQLDGMQKKLDEQDARGKRLEEAQASQVRQRYADQHRMVLAALAAKDPTYQDPTKQQELIDFAQREGIPRLDHAYELATKDARLKEIETRAREAGLKEGLERGKRDAAQPIIPLRRLAPTPPEDAPKSFDEAFDRAGRDPEILATLDGYTPS